LRGRRWGLGRIVIVAACAAALFALLDWYFLARSSPRHFPGQFPNGPMFVTDVTAATAFRDHQIKVPPGIGNLRYAADSNSESDPYPFQAVFTMACSGVGAFAKENALYRGGAGTDWPGADGDVLIFAQQHGWHQPDEMAQWFQRPRDGNQPEIMITGRSVCTVYLWDLHSKPGRP
jgi:hypothetical protein